MPQVWFGLSRWAILLVVSCQLLPVTPSRTRASFKQANTVKVLGDFSSIKHAGDDAFGYSLKLWKEGNQIFGLFSVYTGAPADPAAGILEDVKFDSHTRQLSFSARLSTGVVNGRGNSGVASRDRFTFRGVLRKKEVTGLLTRSDQLFSDDRPKSKRIRLRQSEFLTELMIPPPPTYSEWKTWADEILQRRGPKW